jgi:hypothetical protein
MKTSIAHKCTDALLLFFLGLVIPGVIALLSLFLVAFIHSPETSTEHDVYNLISALWFCCLVALGIRAGNRMLSKRAMQRE